MFCFIYAFIFFNKLHYILTGTNCYIALKFVDWKFSKDISKSNNTIYDSIPPNQEIGDPLFTDLSNVMRNQDVLRNQRSLLLPGPNNTVKLGKMFFHYSKMDH